MVQHRTQYLEEILIENNNSQNKILVLDVDGIITSMAVDRSGRSMVDVIDDQFKAAAKDNAIRAVVLKINSPGGEVLASDEIYNRIKEFQQTTKKPVVASMQALAASGGYYIAAPCRWIVANEMTITGSIGVIMQGYNWRGLMDKIGVRPEVFKSGKFKDMLSSDKRPEEITPEERKMVQDLVMETYAKFTNIVATGRSTAANLNNGNGKQLDDSWAEFADGRILSGNQAFKLGFVDELGNFQTAIDRAEVLAKISNANLIRYQEPFDLGSIFKLFGKTDANKVTLDLGLQTPVLRPGYTYFLMPTAVP
jgi:protease-4